MYLQSSPNTCSIASHGCPSTKGGFNHYRSRFIPNPIQSRELFDGYVGPKRAIILLYKVISGIENAFSVFVEKACFREDGTEGIHSKFLSNILTAVAEVNPNENTRGMMVLS